MLYGSRRLVTWAVLRAILLQVIVEQVAAVLVDLLARLANCQIALLRAMPCRLLRLRNVRLEARIVVFRIIFPLLPLDALLLARQLSLLLLEHLWVAILKALSMR